jgi:stage V sporulation protein AE
MIGQMILDNTTLTPGHVTSMFVVIGAILSFLGIYEYIRDYSLVGSSIPITSFGNALYQASLEGFKENSYLINDEKGIEEFGSSAYFVNTKWLNNE